VSIDSDASNEHLQIHQEAKGDRNQVIGQVLGGIVINQLTIHDRVPAVAAPSPISVAPSLTQQEYRQRQVLLNKVKEYWVKGVLETSLHTRALIELGLQTRSDLVQHPFREVAEFPEISGQSLGEGTSATTVFEQMGAGRTLLILGEPGSGKTITLLKLAEDLIARSQKDISQPIPVVFNLSSWAKKSQTIEQWLVQELLEKYQVSKTLGKQWVETESLILLLDGLDEVKAEQRNACVQALNQFMQTHSTTELTVCCRIEDYQVLTEQLMLRSAVCIQPLTFGQVEQYLVQAEDQLTTLKTILQQDTELRELAKTPLMLSIMSLTYQGCFFESLSQTKTTEERYQQLFDAYVKRMLQRRGTTQSYSNIQTQHWLSWLAHRMSQASQTVFLIEGLQPSWLPNSVQQIIYRLVSGLVGGLALGLMLGLTNGLTLGLFHVLSSGLSKGLMDGLTSGVRIALFFGLSIEKSYGLTFGLIGGLIIGSLGSIKTFETLKWSWQEFRRNLWPTLTIGVILGMSWGWIVSGAIISLIDGAFVLSILVPFGFSGGLVGGLIAGLRAPDIQKEGYPNQGIVKSAQNAIILGAISWLMIGLIWGLIWGLIGGLTNGLTFGLIGGLIGGGSACIQHFILRLVLSYQGASPWNYAHFLDYAADRLFLQKVGGGYIFAHRMLLEHFASMPLEQKRR
jgi:hypothetical protein